ncbi:hypothetical protein CDCA_CDCA06G1769 [Cyanidium caldarium]|uniref:E3 ubiquitin-protein ligase n=1 Tax=Cyanidium caldarium TaxID=2771 RepID=A0AAV9IUA9_CYACA|nr:hypothetical protein CDCA_CDCA06G1769 [Cyanidium caldarium]
MCPLKEKKVDKSRHAQSSSVEDVSVGEKRARSAPSRPPLPELLGPWRDGPEHQRRQLQRLPEAMCSRWRALLEQQNGEANVFADVLEEVLATDARAGSDEPERTVDSPRLRQYLLVVSVVLTALAGARYESVSELDEETGSPVRWLKVVEHVRVPLYVEGAPCFEAPPEWPRLPTPPADAVAIPLVIEGELPPPALPTTANSWPAEKLFSYALPTLTQLVGGSTVCGKVWSANELAYKCRTCERDPTCAICVECFRDGHHQGHEFLMIKTGGGCCDCGDAQAWDVRGFCRRHRGAASEDDQVLNALQPAELKRAVQQVAEALSAQIAMRLRGLEAVGAQLRPERFMSRAWLRQEVERPLLQVGHLCGLLTALCRAGNAPLRMVGMAAFDSTAVPQLVDYDMHRCMLHAFKNASPRAAANAGESGERLGAEDGRICQAGYDHPVWGVSPQYAGVQKAAYKLLFNLVLDLTCKRQFVTLLAQRYVRMTSLAMRAADAQRPARVSPTAFLDHFSVQLLTVPALVPLMTGTGRRALLRQVAAALRRCLGGQRTRRLSLSAFLDEHQRVVYRILYDLRYILTHPEAAEHALYHDRDLWTLLLQDTFVLLQYAEPMRRQTGAHIEFENEAWMSTLSFELELQNLAECWVRGFRRAATAQQRSKLESVFGKLLMLARDRAAHPPKPVGESAISVHLPLHRLGARMLADGLARQPSSEWLLRAFPTAERGVSIARDPVRIQVLMAQVQAGMWRRNGLTMARLAALYRSRYCCSWYLDLDLFLLQALAACWPEALVQLAMQEFQVDTDDDDQHVDKSSSASSPPREDCLALLVWIVSDRHRCGMDAEQVIRQCVVQKLAAEGGQCPFSELSRSALSEMAAAGEERLSNVSEAQVSAVVTQVATFHRPQGVEQGVYRLRESAWRCFDPFYARYSRRDREDAQEAYDQYRRARHMPLNRVPEASLAERPLYACFHRLGEVSAAALPSLIAPTLEAFSETRTPGSRWSERAVVLASYLLLCGAEMGAITAAALSAGQWERWSQAARAIDGLSPCYARLREYLGGGNEVDSMGSESTGKPLDATVSSITSATASDTETARRREAIRTRQAALLERMRQQQQRFLQHNPDAALAEPSPSESAPSADEELVCALCHEPPSGGMDGRLCWLALAQRTTLLEEDAQRRLSGREPRVSASPRARPPEWEVAATAAATAGRQAAQLSWPLTAAAMFTENGTAMMMPPPPPPPLFVPDAAAANAQVAEVLAAADVDIEDSDVDIAVDFLDTDESGDEHARDEDDDDNDDLISLPSPTAAPATPIPERDIIEQRRRPPEGEGAYPRPDLRLAGEGAHEDTLYERLLENARQMVERAWHTWSGMVSGRASPSRRSAVSTSGALPDHLGAQVAVYTQSLRAIDLPSLLTPPLRRTNEGRRDGRPRRRSEVMLLFCGHALHYACYQRYRATLAGRVFAAGAVPISAADQEFLCPGCRRVANTIVPLSLSAVQEADMAETGWDLAAVVRRGPPVNAASASAVAAASGAADIFPAALPPSLYAHEWQLPGAMSDAERQAQQLVRLVGTTLATSEIAMRRHVGDEEETRPPQLRLSAARRRHLSALVAVAREHFARYHPWTAHWLWQLTGLSALTGGTDPQQAWEHLRLELLNGLRTRTEGVEGADVDGAAADLAEWLERAPSRLDGWWLLLHAVLSWPAMLDAITVKALVRIGYVLVLAGCGALGDGGVDRAAVLLYLRRAALLFLVTGLPVPTAAMEDGDCWLSDCPRELHRLFDLPIPTADGEVLLPEQWQSASAENDCVERQLLQVVAGGRPFRAAPRDTDMALWRPRLVRLPPEYPTLLEQYAPVLKQSSRLAEASICLICGLLMSGRQYGGRATSAEGSGAGGGAAPTDPFTHARLVHAGFGLALVLRRTQVLMIRERRAACFLSPYLDAHGEEDVDFRRGRVLTLSHHRMEYLQDLYVSQGLDHDTRMLSASQMIL